MRCTRVLDFSRVLAGPYASQILGDMGKTTALDKTRQTTPDFLCLHVPTEPCGCVVLCFACSSYQRQDISLSIFFSYLIHQQTGAEVIKVESIDGDDTRKWGPPFAKGGESAYFISLNRNKLSITVDMKHPASKQIIDKLILRSDVLIENFISGTAEKLGIGYERVARMNERMVYCSVTGFGTTGPYAQRPGYDAICRC